MSKFNPLDSSLEVWIPSDISSNKSSVKPWTSDDVIERSDECGLIGSLLTTYEIGSENYEYIINMIIYNKAKETHLYNAFQHALSLGDLLSISRENIEMNAIGMRGEIKFHHILLYGICLNLDQPGFGYCFHGMKLFLEKNFESNRIRRFLFDNGEGDRVFIEIIKDCIAMKAPFSNVSYAENNECGPIIPIRYHYQNKESKESNDKVTAWLNRDENLFAFRKEEGCDNVVMKTLLSMLQKASDRIPENIQRDFQQESSGLFNLSYLYVVDPKEPKVDVAYGYMKCSNPSCIAHSKKSCARCTAPYCSATCQKEHFPEHKSYCKAVAKLSNTETSRNSVLIDDASHFDISTLYGGTSNKGEIFATSFSMNGSGHSSDKLPGKTKLKHINGELILKVQGNISPKCLFKIYDEYRRVDNILFNTESVPGGILYNFLKNQANPYPQQSPYHALQKCYLFARTEVGGLRIFTDKLAPWQAW